MNLNLDLSSVETRSGDFEPIPAGIYEVICADCELKDNKAGTGKFLSFAFDVIGPSHANRKLWLNLTIQHETSAQAQEIGQRSLKEYAEAIGHPNPNQIKSTNELVGKPVLAKVGIDKKDPTRNSVIGFRQKKGAAAPPFEADAQKPATATKGRAVNPFAD